MERRFSKLFYKLVKPRALKMYYDNDNMSIENVAECFDISHTLMKSWIKKDKEEKKRNEDADRPDSTD